MIIEYQQQIYYDDLVNALVRLVHEEQEAANCEAESESGEHVINIEALLAKLRYLEVLLDILGYFGGTSR